MSMDIIMGHATISAIRRSPCHPSSETPSTSLARDHAPQLETDKQTNRPRGEEEKNTPSKLTLHARPRPTHSSTNGSRLSASIKVDVTKCAGPDSPTCIRASSSVYPPPTHQLSLSLNATQCAARGREVGTYLVALDVGAEADAEGGADGEHGGAVAAHDGAVED